MRKNVVARRKPISNENEIGMYLHCAKCFDAMPDGVSPKEYQRIQAGWTEQGLQIWCTRHECNIIHIDFEGVQHRANTSAEG